MQERRDVFRYKINLRSTVKSSSSTEEKESKCLCQDISTKGARLVLSEPLAENQEIDLKINLPRYFVPILIKAQIAWKNQISNSDNSTTFEAGVFFTKVKDRDKTEIMDFLKEAFPEEILAQWWNGV